MSHRRQVAWMILCEDRQHQNFARRLLEERGFHPRRIRTAALPAGRGAADRYVLDGYADEVRAIRRFGSSTRGLLVVLDADRQSVSDRQAQLQRELQQSGMNDRGDAEPIVHLIPKRCIETWIRSLRGEQVSEADACRHFDSTQPCRDEVRGLLAFCAGSPGPRLPSLVDACTELERLKHLS